MLMKVSLPYCKRDLSIMNPKINPSFAISIYIPRQGRPVPSEDRHIHFYLAVVLALRLVWSNNFPNLVILWVGRYEIRSLAGVIM